MLMTRDAQFAPGRISVVPASSTDADAAAEASETDHSFLRGAWAEAAAPGAVRFWAAVRADGSPLAVLPLVLRKAGPLAVREVAGCYWPFRSIALAADAQPHELTAMLSADAMKRALGLAWRIGPVFETDRAAVQLAAAARAAGWAVLRRRLGTCFEIDVQALQADGPWPRGSTMRKNRWREKRLSENGPLETISFTGTTWSAAQRDAIAEVERHSWLAKLGDKAAFQFADPARRLYWERVASDPAIAEMVFGAILTVGGVPAAFSFGLQAGGTRYQIANNFDERFSAHSAGRTLLLKEFEQAAARGVQRISWGSGDAGYKTEIGARPGPAIDDLLFVRPKLLALPLRRWWSGPPASAGSGRP